MNQLELVKQSAREYIQNGFYPIPIESNDKAVKLKGWVDLRMKNDEIDTYFIERRNNIGLITSFDCFVVDFDLNPWIKTGNMSEENINLLKKYEAKYGKLDHSSNGSGSSLNYWKRLLDKYNGGLPLNTPTQTTGSGGKQIFIKLPKDFVNKYYVANNKTGVTAKLIHPAIDTRGYHGQVVVYPSIHPCGNRYEWIIDYHTPIINCPEWLKHILISNWKDEFKTSKEIDLDSFSNSTPSEIINITPIHTKEHKVEDNYIDFKNITSSKLEEIKILVNSDIPIKQPRKKQLSQIAYYYRHCLKKTGEELINEVMPHLKRVMQYDPTDVIKEERIIKICQSVDKNYDPNYRENKYGINNEINKNADLLKYLMQFNKFPYEILIDTISDYASEYNKCFYSPKEYSACASLISCASLIGSKQTLLAKKAMVINSNIGVILVGDSGTNKTHPMNNAIKVISDSDDNEHSIYKQKLKEFEFRYPLDKKYKIHNEDKMDKPVRKRYLLKTFTIEALAGVLEENPEGVLIYSDEFAGRIKALNQYKNGKGDDLEKLMSVIDGQGISDDRKNGSYKTKHSAACVLGSLQPDIFKDIFKNGIVYNGFAFRFLFCYPKPIIFKLGPDANESVFENYYKLLEEMKHIISNPLPLTYDDEAQIQMEKYINEDFHNLAKKYEDDKIFRGIMSKLITYFWKFSLILHCIKYRKHLFEHPSISKDIVDDSYKLTMYFLCQNYRLLSQNYTKEDKINNLYDSLVVLGKQEISIRDDIQRKTKKFGTSKEQIIEKVNILIEENKAEWINDNNTFKLL